jgi:hypothetical protein
MKTTKPVLPLIVFAAILTASTAKTLGASASDDIAAVTTGPSCCSQSRDSMTNSLANVSVGANAEATICVVCGDETTRRMNYSSTQTDVLIKATNPKESRSAITFFRDAVINVGKVSQNGEIQDRDAASFREAATRYSFAGREETRREPQGLKLFSWRW